MMIFQDRTAGNSLPENLFVQLKDKIIPYLLFDDSSRYFIKNDTITGIADTIIPFYVFTEKRFSNLFNISEHDSLYHLASGIDDNFFRLIAAYTHSDPQKMCNNFYIAYNHKYFEQLLFFIKIKKRAPPG